MKRIEDDAGTPTYMAISPKGYENLAIGIGELRRFILQQNEILDYYEKSLTDGEKTNGSQTSGKSN